MENEKSVRGTGIKKPDYLSSNFVRVLFLRLTKTLRNYFLPSRDYW